ncbi:hypothetical protein GUITHDRAFT_153887 [Guillardia theta CCMP2712]|uniref:RWP-RK domain-containing protein n=2 Tax=Guillardia theta TaxID=55529 RepID=L1IZ91_GUITC|nr:hypothetical protein GUITHDRAFT_153887 [Guillardia theta CCMP2712]EKX41214.1 hypothetical protein GUITHDRAFT_153887 [Guillardia theta CCMP2712]|eukprot:XP_005828194.1 hypothetical protein GUITHDRAFT_153887 [Guillardia theta CCMP2712]
MEGSHLNATTRPYHPQSCRPRKINLKLKDISKFFHLRQSEAAKQLGISLTSLKSSCRRFGILRWPSARGNHNHFMGELPVSPSPEPSRPSNDTSSASAARASSNLPAAPAEEGEAPPLDPAWMEWFLETPLTPVEDEGGNVGDLVEETSLPCL